ncbi:cytochrome P450 [Streptomyces sp. NPDC058280]|uniref:cytochrome P450 n=1 Tax=Streptomyces sp. NPDC058280 TaxID=3346419 RepID=UPI0036E45BE1
MSMTANSPFAASTPGGSRDWRTVLASSDVYAVLSDPVVMADPLPLAAWLRENAPVYRRADGEYLVSRYEDVSRLFRAPIEQIRVEAAGILRSGAMQHHPSVRRLADTIGLRNPPEHTRLNRVYMRYFTAARVSALRERTRVIVAESVRDLMERLTGGEQADLRELATALPTHMMSLLLDLSPEDVSWLSTCVWHIEQPFDPTLTDARLADADRSSEELDAFVVDLVARRRGGGGSDLITVLADMRDDEGGLSQNDIIAMVFTILAGGGPTMAFVIALALWRTLVRREHIDRLDGSPGGAAAYVEELLRFESPAMYSPIPRVAVRDIELGGEVLPAGSRIFGLITGANHDPRAFQDPGVFDPSRFDSSSRRRGAAPVLAYGTGIHRCVGSHLASMELEVVLDEIYPLLPDLRLEGPVTWGRTSYGRNVTALPVRLGTPAPAGSEHQRP